jgi:adenine-specific DNA-methyltransferase
VVGIGPELGPEDAYETGPTEDGLLRIYPLGENVERVWRNARETTCTRIANGELRCTVRGTIVQVIAGEEKNVPVRSVWTGARYNAGERGTNLVKALTGVDFPYPKSLYTVADCLKAIVGKRPNAVILDFFGGSGTTLHAVAMMNALDKGGRRCVLVTNNELGPEREEELRSNRVLPGDDAWEAEGICRAVTWPRCRNAILGCGPNDAPLPPELVYETGTFETFEENPKVAPLSFVDPARLTTRQARAELAGLLGLSATSLNGADGSLIPTSPARGQPKQGLAVLLDPARGDAFAEAIAENGDHVREVRYVPPPGGVRIEQQLRESIVAALPKLQVEREVLRPMALGLPANAAYLRLEFVDPLDVERGQGLQDLLPSLWAMAGAKGSIPVPAGDEPWLMPDDGTWAILIKRSRFRGFLHALAARPEIAWVFIVAPSEDAFSEMAALLPPTVPQRQRMHLYRRYLENFVINGGTK